MVDFSVELPVILERISQVDWGPLREARGHIQSNFERLGITLEGGREHYNKHFYYYLVSNQILKPLAQSKKQGYLTPSLTWINNNET